MTTTTNIKRCYQCNVPLEQGQPIYSAGDTAQCSEECMVIRSNFIEAIDPELKSPSSWTDIQEFYQFNTIPVNTIPVNTISVNTTQVHKRGSPLKKVTTRIWIDIDDLFKPIQSVKSIKTNLSTKSITPITPTKSNESTKENNCYKIMAQCFKIVFIISIISGTVLNFIIFI